MEKRKADRMAGIIKIPVVCIICSSFRAFKLVKLSPKTTCTPDAPNIKPKSNIPINEKNAELIKMIAPKITIFPINDFDSKDPYSIN
ncbi:hypothetical protein [Tenuifilum sp.]|uniref:hypothetical protein n=1 Tax=Tenuifilum sp. TaxID=2760880 RepID=UPI002C6E6F59|nr:hypothetical protein [Tenuifilum sp.]HQE55355.1 hypothetical protein [Tenuifilum sp.]HQG73226.1 hypothetical protein [Tenuifilum sp.]HQI89829.1 hypothetical protein [Tenuifilum sp.]HRR12418.1 hypothetical protein [Tenuifilum sp.]